MLPFKTVVSAIDTHTAGEPARIILSGLPPILGDSMAQKKAYFSAHLDHWRTLLIQEPRGHKDMFGVILTAPAQATADFGALFIDSDGAIDMCGHGLMALTTALIETNHVQVNAPEISLRFDTPAGLVETRATMQGQRVGSVSVINVPSFVIAQNLAIWLPKIGDVAVDVVFAGNVVALVPGSALGVPVDASHAHQLISLGMAIKNAVNASMCIIHPDHAHICTVQLTKIYDRLDPSRSDTTSVVIFGQGQLDRSPCGTGTSAMMTLAYAKGELELGEEHISENLLGSCFRGHLQTALPMDPDQAVVPVVSGVSHLTGISHFVMDPRDPLPYGFLVGGSR